MPANIKQYTHLKRLLPEARRKITAESYLDRPAEDMGRYMEDIGRNVNLAPLHYVMAAGMQKFADLDAGKREESDAWFAPRLHASLRLSRREAADIAVWHFLTAVVFRDYVIWRWGHGTGILNRVFGAERRNALAHLWWAAELGRNGSSYEPVVEACAVQELIVTLTDVAFSQNRAAAQAFLRFIQNGPGGKRRSAKEVQDYRTQLNCMLAATVLDALAPDPGPDPVAMEEWINEDIDPTLLVEDKITGPNDPLADAQQIDAIIDLLKVLERAAASPVARVKASRKLKEPDASEAEMEDAYQSQSGVVAVIAPGDNSG